MRRAMTYIGVLTFLAGMCSMDSKSLLIPAVMVIGGGLLTYFSIEKGPQAYT